MIKRRNRWWRPLLVVVLLWMLIHCTYACIDGLHQYKGKADIAIVLGNRVYKDSTLSPVLQGRVERALELYREGQVTWLMVSGGLGKKDKMGGVPEGMAMKLYLVARGVPADRIVADDKGENTYLTAKDFLPVADSLHIHSAIVVSSFYHITRTKYIFRHLGFRDIHSAASETFYWHDLLDLPRDVVAFYKYLLVY
ncbi:YdcF family protein [Puia dinghuensis]|uniref:DUF218 domain-containing protein n=1 Tax=Puia dinghuensis TaxID=1792502 RepID=A0A8J2U644_9BACT|nr:YdcF family protein [Puia dinghuensis]GGA81237.1 hypothetical protein GCM10011511_00250 [Puia dinghuensis]